MSSFPLTNSYFSEGLFNHEPGNIIISPSTDQAFTQNQDQFDSLAPIRTKLEELKIAESMIFRTVIPRGSMGPWGS